MTNLCSEAVVAGTEKQGAGISKTDDSHKLRDEERPVG